MSNPKKVKVRAANFADPATGKRETFRIAVSVPKGGASEERDAAQRTLDNATQIFQSLIESGRLPKK